MWYDQVSKILQSYSILLFRSQTCKWDWFEIGERFRNLSDWPPLRNETRKAESKTSLICNRPILQDSQKIAEYKLNNRWSYFKIYYTYILIKITSLAYPPLLTCRGVGNYRKLFTGHAWVTLCHRKMDGHLFCKSLVLILNLIQNVFNLRR